MKKILLFLTAMFVAVAANAAPATEMYLIGNPAGDWSPTKGLPLQKTSEGVFELDITFPATQWFGFANKLLTTADWNTFNSQCRYNPPSNNYVPQLDTPVSITLGGSDRSFQLGAGDWHFKVDTNTNKFTVSGQVIEDPNANVFYLRGEVSGWGTPDLYKFKQEGNVYTLEVANLYGAFKIANSDYSKQFSTTTPIELNTEVSVSNMGSDNCTLAQGSASNVTITFVKESDNAGKLTISGEAVVTYPETMHIIGNVNGADGDWNPAEGVEMVPFGEGVYVSESVYINGAFSFAVKLGDWDVVNAQRYVPASGEDTPLALGEPAGVKLGNDKSFSAPDAAFYTVNLNLVDKTVTITKAPVDYTQWYVNILGDFNNWEDNGVAANAEGIAKHDNLPIGTSSFKVKVYNGASVVWFSTGGALAQNTWVTIPGNNEANMTIEDAVVGDMFNVEYNCADNSIKVVKVVQDGIANVAVDANAPVEYFNLQGVRVAQPATGLYIVRQGGKVSKVYVK